MQWNNNIYILQVACAKLVNQFHTEVEQDIEFYNILLTGYLKSKRAKQQGDSDKKPQDNEDTKREADKLDGSGSDSPEY